MVRASLGLYTTEDDLNALKHAIETITTDPQRFRAAYELTPEGNYVHRTAHLGARELFDPAQELSRHLAAAQAAASSR
jgi:predicted transcriptional regulator